MGQQKTATIYHVERFGRPEKRCKFGIWAFQGVAKMQNRENTENGKGYVRRRAKKITVLGGL